MAKLNRITQKLFGYSGDPSKFGVFGSLAAGAPQTSKNLSTIQSLAAFLGGWGDAVIGGNSPTVEDMNSLFLLAFSQLAYVLQSGIPEWDAATDYYVGGFASYNGILYYSIANANTGNIPPLSPASWSVYDTAPSGALVPFGGIVVPSNYGLCDGGTESRTARASLFAASAIQATGNTVSGSAIISSMSTTAYMAPGYPISGPGVAAGAKVLSVDSGTQIHITANATATAVGVALVVAPWGVGDGTTTFNRPDLRGRTIIGTGAGTGLTARTLAQTLGAETVTLTSAQIPAHTHPVTQTPHSHGYNTTSPDLDNGGNFGGARYGNWTGYSTAGANANVTVAANTGGGGSHENMPPSGVANWIIRY